MVSAARSRRRTRPTAEPCGTPHGRVVQRLRPRQRRVASDCHEDRRRAKARRTVLAKLQRSRWPRTCRSPRVANAVGRSTSPSRVERWSTSCSARRRATARISVGETSWCARSSREASASGVISFAFSLSSRRFTSELRMAATGLAASAGVALDVAERFDRERTTAATLVAAILPDQLPVLDGWSIVARYCPSGDAVCGDWYDVSPLPDGQLLVGVGDAAGHGLAAATLMAELRNAARGIGFAGHNPSQLLAGLSACRSPRATSTASPPPRTDVSIRPRAPGRGPPPDTSRCYSCPSTGRPGTSTWPVHHRSASAVRPAITESTCAPATRSCSSPMGWWNDGTSPSIGVSRAWNRPQRRRWRTRPSSPTGSWRSCAMTSPTTAVC